MNVYHRKLLGATSTPLASDGPIDGPLFFVISYGSPIVTFIVMFIVFNIAILRAIGINLCGCCCWCDQDEYPNSLSLPTRTSFPAPHVTSLSKETIYALPVFPYLKEESCRVDCAICLGEFEEEEAVKKIPFCKHIFHPECLDKWLSWNTTCPLCRSTQMVEHAQHIRGDVFPEASNAAEASAQGSTFEVQRPLPTMPV